VLRRNGSPLLSGSVLDALPLRTELAAARAADAAQQQRAEYHTAEKRPWRPT